MMGVLNLVVVMGYAMTTFLTIRWMIADSDQRDTGTGRVILSTTVVAVLHAASLKKTSPSV